MYCKSSAPTNYLLCDGSSINRTTYATLYNVIGTAYGNVDANNFNLPDLMGRVPIGSGAGSGLTNRVFPTTSANSKVGSSESTALVATDIPAHSHNHTLASNVSATANTVYSYKTTTNTGSAANKDGSGVQLYNSTGVNVSVTNGALTGSISNSTASSTSPSIMQPSTIITYCIKYQ